MVDTPIGTNSPNYTLVSGDVGATIFCRVTASNASGSAQAFSNAVGPVAAAGGPVPGITVAPAVTVASGGASVTCNTGTWTNSPTGYAYQWYSDETPDVPISGATSATYVIDGGVIEAPYVAQGVRFDGTNDYMARTADLTGAADSKVGICSFWFKMKGGNDGFQMIMEDGDSGTRGLQILRMSDNTLRFLGNSAVPLTVLQMSSTGTFTDAMSWTHILAAWDLAGATAQLYVNDVDGRAGSPTITDAAIDYTGITDWFIGARTGGALLFDAEVAAFYLNTAATLDMSNSTNRRKFIDGSGAPVDLGADGSTPTGSAPIIFLSGATASWHTNKGTGGGFTLTGALTDAADNP